MAMARLQFRPGIDVEKTASLNKGGWSLSNLIRWREGLPESLMGWLQATAATIAGVARSLYFWADLGGSIFYAIGSNQKLYILPVTNTQPFSFGALTDITPALFLPGPASSSGGTLFGSWTLDNFGGTLIACPKDQGIFTWTNGQIVAAQIQTAPKVNRGILVLDQAQIIMAYGCGSINGLIGPDPLLLRWCDASDYTSWAALTTNQAGSYRLSRGTRIIGGLQIPGMALLWTDVALWMVQYIGFPLVFSFQVAGQLCGLIGQKAAIALGGIVYWMSDHGFFRSAGGTVEQIPCPVWDQVFLNLDQNNADKCCVGGDYHYSEVWFFYPSLSGGSGEIDSYVKLNVQEGSWDYGPALPNAPNLMARTAWTDLNEQQGPLSVDLSGLIQQQDTGLTANGAALPSSIRSGFIDIAEGGELVSVNQLLPDFKWQGDNPSLTMSLYFRKWPGDTPTQMGPFTITPTTEYITLRSPRQITIDKTVITAYPSVRAREVAIEIDGVSGWWRLGNCRLRMAPSGRAG